MMCIRSPSRGLAPSSILTPSSLSLSPSSSSSLSSSSPLFILYNHTHTPSPTPSSFHSSFHSLSSSLPSSSSILSSPSSFSPFSLSSPSPLPSPSLSSPLPFVPRRHITSRVTTLEVAARKACIPSSNPNVPFNAVDSEIQKKNTLFAWDRIRNMYQSDKSKSENVVFSPFLEMFQSKQFDISTLHSWKNQIAMKNNEISFVTFHNQNIHKTPTSHYSYAPEKITTNPSSSSPSSPSLSPTPKSLSFTGYLMPKIQVSSPNGPAWFLPHHPSSPSSPSPLPPKISSQFVVRSGKLFYSESTPFQLAEIPYINSPFVFSIINPRPFEGDQTIQFHPKPFLYNQMMRKKTNIDEMINDDKIFNGNDLVEGLRGMSSMGGTVALPTFKSVSPLLDSQFHFLGEGLHIKRNGAQGLPFRSDSIRERFFLSAHRPFVWAVRDPSSGIVIMAGIVNKSEEFDWRRAGIIIRKRTKWFDRINSEKQQALGQ